MTPLYKLTLSIALILLCSRSLAVETLSFFNESMQSDITLSVSLPENYEFSRREYPLVFVFDGPAYFDLVNEYSKKLYDTHRIPEVIVIGVANANRFQDFVGTNSAEFTKLIVEDTNKVVSEKYRTNKIRLGIGHSLGASFLLKSHSEF